MKPILELKNIQKSYSKKAVLKSLSFEVHPGEIIGLLGPNGAGKTTAFYMTMGLLKPDDGKIFFEGQDVTNLPIHKRAKIGIGYLAQEPSIFRDMTVEENITCVLETLDISKSERINRLEASLDELNLKSLRKTKAVCLSGGERRRLEITRALITKPKLLLLDEPFANVDPITISNMKQMIRILKNRGIAILITDHNAKEIFSIVDKSYLVVDGTVIASGNTAEIVASDEARNRYLGLDFTL